MVDHFVLFKMRMIANAGKREIDKTTSSIGLTTAQSIILGYIHNHSDRELCQRDIERKFNLKHPTVTGIMKRLEEKGFIKCVPSPKDRRFKIISETEKALALHEEIETQLTNINKRFTSILSDEELECLENLLNKIIDNVAPQSVNPDFIIDKGEYDD